MVYDRLFSEFLVDEGVLSRIRVENFMLVYLGLRPCSQMTLPAELPNGEVLGNAIDREIFPWMDKIRSETNPRNRLKIIADTKREMRVAYDKVVKNSDQYKSHLFWAERLGLRNRIVEVRPTVGELYLFKETEVGERLRKLMKDREKFRAEAYTHASPEMGKARFAYPEEFRGSWLRDMGNVLGYPDCCVAAYASDREGGRNVEGRASTQLKEAEESGVVDPFIYFVGYFFPCKPDCERALAKGRECHERLKELSPRLGEFYAQLVVENRERVGRQPDVITEYQRRASVLPKD